MPNPLQKLAMLLRAGVPTANANWTNITTDTSPSSFGMSPGYPDGYFQVYENPADAPQDGTYMDSERVGPVNYIPPERRIENPGVPRYGGEPHSSLSARQMQAQGMHNTDRLNEVPVRGLTQGGDAAREMYERIMRRHALANRQ